MTIWHWIPRALLMLSLALPGPALAADPSVPRPFVAGSYREILAAHAGQPLAVAFWSLECSHCPGSLRTLAEFRRGHPGLRVVLISTDPAASATTASEHLRELGLDDGPQWIFADPLPERLRREIDPRWWGELPRTELIDARGRRLAKSGALDAASLAAWWTNATRN